jgi:hypothetical protein
MAYPAKTIDHDHPRPPHCIKTLFNYAPSLIGAVDDVFSGENGEVLRVFVEAQYKDVARLWFAAYPDNAGLAIKRRFQTSARRLTGIATLIEHRHPKQVGDAYDKAGTIQVFSRRAALVAEWSTDLAAGSRDYFCGRHQVPPIEV